MDGLYSKCINTYAITTLCLLFIQLAITLTVMSPPTTTSILFSILCRFMTLSQLSQFQFEVATQQNAKKKKKKVDVCKILYLECSGALSCFCLVATWVFLLCTVRCGREKDLSVLTEPIPLWLNLTQSCCSLS